MRFVFADSVDTIDPDYDFVADRNGAGRSVHRDDQYPHEFLEQAPYDGILVSRGIVGDARHPGKYSEAQLMRFRREGARRFLRYPLERFPGSMLMGDCGAFTYRNLPEPPYSAEDTAEFYADGGFTHGCSPDHLIFDFDELGVTRTLRRCPRRCASSLRNHASECCRVLQGRRQRRRRLHADGGHPGLVGREHGAGRLQILPAWATTISRSAAPCP